MDNDYLTFPRKSRLISSQVLAVDLLNPSPAAEARKHKLKVEALSKQPLTDAI